MRFWINFKNLALAHNLKKASQIPFSLFYDNLIMERFSLILISLWLGASFCSLQAQFASESVLATGECYKIAVTQTGLHKIDANFLENLGINLNTLNPKQLHIYGNGGGMLPQANDANRLDDLQENRIWVSGEADNRFDPQDYILFYAEGSDKLRYNALAQRLEYEKNLYADTNYYFIKISAEPALRVNPQNSLPSGDYICQYYDEVYHHEQDLQNIIRSGREWYGELFDFEATRDYTVPVSGMRANSDFSIEISVIGRSNGETAFVSQVNGQNLGTQSISPVGSGVYDIKGAISEEVFSQNSNVLGGNSTLELRLNYDKRGLSALAYLNYFTLRYQRDLQLYEQASLFRSLESLNHSSTEYRLANASSDLRIWEISEPHNAQEQNYTLVGNEARFALSNNGELRQFIVFRGENHPLPTPIGQLPNQNLHGLNAPNLLIITAPELRSEAERLGQFRRSHDALSVEVVSTTEIYNEFSSGRQDITALRDFARMLYERNPSNFRYLLLFGDASYDYKFRRDNNTNLVPVYESRQSLHPIFSFSSDDYYALLESNEGIWEENSGGDADLEIGVGRLTVRNLEEAQNVVNKLIAYAQDPNRFGAWRQQVAFIADDGDANTHQQHADLLAELVRNNQPKYQPEKLFMDNYEQVATPSGELVPELSERIDQVLEQGALIVNYTGHGGEVGWAEENLLNIEQIRAWRNTPKLPLFVTATCEFGRYDNASVQSGAEEALSNARGGAIGLITTTRPVFSSTNLLLNQAFYAVLFQPVDGEMPRLGDIIRATKNNSLNGSINRNFALLGDPSMRLAYPENNIVITQLNGETLNPIADTLSALEQVVLVGEIQSPDGTLKSNFNGLLNITVLDKAQSKTTNFPSSVPMTYQVQNSYLFRGQASVENGRFELSFIVPKDINYQFGEGLVRLYAQNEENTEDAAGAQRFVIGGTDESVTLDQTPPKISLFLNDSSFVSGQIVEPNVLLKAYFYDEQGINISNQGIGHQITLTLDNDPETAQILNDFYLANVDNYRQGQLAFPLKELSPGRHSLQLKAWDTHNNSTTAEIYFEVSEKPFLQIIKLDNYPNPFSTYTNFRLRHNRLETDLYLHIDIFNTRGERVTSLEKEVLNASKELEIRWEGLDKAGNRLAVGLYFYRLRLTSLQDGVSTQGSGKLILTY